jgi:MFS family permease
VLLGPIVDRIGERWTMRTGCLVLIVGLLLYPLVHDLRMLTIFVIPLVPIGTALLFPSTTSLISSRTPKLELGVTMGVAQTFGGIARAAAPVASTKAFEAFGHGWPFYLAAAIVGVVSLLAFRIAPMPPMEPTPVPGAPAAG